MDIFFVISGFIIYHVSKRAFQRKGETRSFWLKRLARVAPLYYICTLAMLAVSLKFGQHLRTTSFDTWQILSSFLFIPSVNGSGQIAPILKLGWTLNYEIFFYFLFGIALAFPRKIGISLIVVVLGILVAAQHIWPGRLLLLDFWGDSLVLEFVGGISIAIAFQSGLRISSFWAVVLIAEAVFALVFLRVTHVLPLLPRAVYAGVPAMAIVAATALGGLGNGSGRVTKMLGAAGDASYALYLTHPFSLRGMVVTWESLRLPQNPYAFMMTTMAVTIIVSFIICRTVEHPLNALLRGWLASKVPDAQVKPG